MIGLRKYPFTAAGLILLPLFLMLPGCSDETSVAIRLEQDFQQVISNARSAIVTIEITSSDTAHSPDDVLFRNAGVIIDGDGCIVSTCEHVKRESGFNVLFQDGCTLSAEIIGCDRETNIALLKTPPHHCGCFPINFIAENDVESGKIGLVVNNSTFSRGVTAGLGIMAKSWLGGDDAWSKPLLLAQTGDNLTMTGAPVIGINGRLIGICDSKIESHNGAWTVIASETIFNVVRELQKHGTVERGWIGVRCTVEDLELFDGNGVKPYIRIFRVVAKSPAELAGIKEGDVILAVDSVKISDIAQLRTIVTNSRKGEKLSLEVLGSDGTINIIELSTKTLPQDDNRNRLCRTRSL